MKKLRSYANRSEAKLGNANPNSVKPKAKPIRVKPKAKPIRKIISLLLMIFILSIVLPSCASNRIYSSSDESRRSLMLGEGIDRSKGKKVRTAKASRSYKKSKKRSNKFKKQKHKYKKRRPKARRR